MMALMHIVSQCVDLDTTFAFFLQILLIEEETGGNGLMIKMMISMIITAIDKTAALV